MGLTILVTNDDGIHAEGIHALRRALAPLGRVYLIAPDREMSAAGHSITVNQPLRVDEVDLPGADLARGWAVNGTPTDCVKLGVEALLAVRPDLVVSGVNLGANLGTDILYSGTVSAAVESVILGIPGLAISLAGRGGSGSFEYAGAVAAQVAQSMLTNGLPPGTLLNVNVPDLAAEAVRGIRVTRLGARRYENVWDKRQDPRGRSYYWMGGDAVDLDHGADVDSTAVSEGYVSVTPVHFDFTHYNIMLDIRAWGMQLPSS